jgi:CHAT domain-containing protein
MRYILKLLFFVLAVTSFSSMSGAQQNKAAPLGNPNAGRVEILVSDGSAALQNGDYVMAESKLETALSELASPDADHTAKADVVLLLAQVKFGLANPSTARELLEKHWSLLETHPDPERFDRANYFMMSYFMQAADYKNASEFSGELMTRYLSRHGATHPITLDSQLNHGSCLYGRGDKKQGLELLDLTFDKLKKSVSKNTYHQRLNMVATSFEQSQQFEASERYYLRQIKSMETEPPGRDLGVSYFNFAILQKSLRKLDDALTYHERAVDILTKVAGVDDPDTIAAVSGFGNTYTVLGRPASGIQLLELGYQRARKVLGDDHNDTWMYGNNYANALRELLRFEEALAIDEAAYAWRVKALGPYHESTEISTLNTGLDLLGLKRFAQADKMFEALYNSRLKRLGKDHPATKDAANFVALSKSYNPKGKSKPRLSQQDIDKLDRFHANIEAGALDQQGEHKKALPFHRRSFEASILEFGPYDPTTLQMQRNFALSTYDAKGNGPELVRVYEDLSRRTLVWAQTEMAATAGKARAEDIRRFANPMIYDIIKLAQGNPEAHHVLFRVLLDWKGLGTSEQVLLNRFRNQQENPEVTSLVNRIEKQKARLRTPSQDAEALLSDINIAELKLAELSAAFRRARSETGIQPSALISKLKPGELLVEYVIGDRPIDPPATPEQTVFAFLIDDQGSAVVKDLGKLSVIQDIMEKVDYQSDTDAREKLFTLLLRPLLTRKVAAKTRHFYLVPDGELFLVPFEGLLNERKQAFGTQFDVTLMRSSAGLGMKADRPQDGAKLLLVGAPDYGPTNSLLEFPDLPAALKEVIDIDTISTKAGFKSTLMTKAQATEAMVRQTVKGHSIVHMATHGFFLPTEFDPALEPIWRGGLALSGANAAKPEGVSSDDGIAYAAELASWPMDDADLVVLSACETASGERSYVEGLRGVPSALAISGAKRSLLALWAVPDEGAANFMATFYEHVFAANKTYEDAFRITKREASEGKIIGAENPAVWQAFVLIRN